MYAYRRNKGATLNCGDIYQEARTRAFADLVRNKGILVSPPQKCSNPHSLQKITARRGKYHCAGVKAMRIFTRKSQEILVIALLDFPTEDYCGGARRFIWIEWAVPKVHGQCDMRQGKRGE